jgi:hypothetical protein
VHLDAAAGASFELPARGRLLSMACCPTARHRPSPRSSPMTPARLAAPDSPRTVVSDTHSTSRSDPYSPCSRLPARCCPLAPANHSASGLAINICDVLVEEGGPRVEAKRRGGDPLPRASCRAKFPERAGSSVFVWVLGL